MMHGALEKTSAIANMNKTNITASTPVENLQNYSTTEHFMHCLKMAS